MHTLLTTAWKPPQKILAMPLVSRLVLIAPMWPTQPWYPVLKSMALREPVILQSIPDLLQNHRGSSNSSRVTKSSHVDSIKKSLDNQGISEGATNLILASWRSNTEQSYSCCWRKLDSWCVWSHKFSLERNIGFSCLLVSTRETVSHCKFISFSNINDTHSHWRSSGQETSTSQQAYEGHVTTQMRTTKT